jgi:hypothetical protein
MLLAVLLFSITPASFIHEFANHHDTDDAIYHLDGVTFSPQHRHCAFLHLEPEPYVNTIITYQSPVQEVIWHYTTPDVTLVATAPLHMLPSRAPPASSSI